jgi:drug/metabolite transporter (DMT)-like permease
MNNSTSGGSNPVLLGGYNFGFDQNSTELTGSHFRDPILVSAIAINGLCVVAFLALAVVTCCAKLSWRAKGRKVFAVLYGLVVAMFLSALPTLSLTNSQPASERSHSLLWLILFNVI